MAQSTNRLDFKKTQTIIYEYLCPQRKLVEIYTCLSLSYLCTCSIYFSFRRGSVIYNYDVIIDGNVKKMNKETQTSSGLVQVCNRLRMRGNLDTVGYMTKNYTSGNCHKDSVAGKSYSRYTLLSKKR